MSPVPRPRHMNRLSIHGLKEGLLPTLTLVDGCATESEQISDYLAKCSQIQVKGNKIEMFSCLATPMGQ